MANMCGASLQCVAIRVTALEPDGTPAPGNAMYVTDQLVKIDFNPEMETGQEISNKNAAGNLCVVYRTPDIMKRLTTEVEICVPDPELETMLSGGDLFMQGTGPSAEVMGWSYPPLMVDPTPNGVSVEAWTRYVIDGYQPPDQPYIWWVFPRMHLRKGNRTIDINAMGSVFDGYGVENPSWGDGPSGDWNWESGRVVQAAFTDSYPTPQCGGQTVPAGPGVANGATSGAPGSWTPSGATPPDDVASLIAGVPNAVVASPTTAWTTGQYVQTATSGTAGRAYWNGTAWTNGTAP